MSEKPKHRCLRFTLGSLLLAGMILCHWLGWQGRVGRERKDNLNAAVVPGGRFANTGLDDRFLNEPVIPIGPLSVHGLPPATWLRQMPGDAAVGPNHAPREASQSGWQSITNVPGGDTVSAWMADAPIVIRVEPYTLRPSQMPSSMDKSLNNDLPSNRQTIRLDD
jgi:hypothetical protein